MNFGIITITPDRKKAVSIFKTAETTLEMIGTIDIRRFPANVAKEYYGVIRELISAIMLLDGLTAKGEGAHKSMIEYLELEYKEFQAKEIKLINELRMTRNRITYDGLFVRPEFIEKKLKDINAIINKLRHIIKNKLS